MNILICRGTSGGSSFIDPTSRPLVKMPTILVHDLDTTSCFLDCHEIMLVPKKISYTKTDILDNLPNDCHNRLLTQDYLSIEQIVITKNFVFTKIIIIASDTYSDDPTCDDTTSDDPTSNDTSSDVITYTLKTTARKGPPKKLLKWVGTIDEDISQFQVVAKHFKLRLHLQAIKGSRSESYNPKDLWTDEDIPQFQVATKHSKPKGSTSKPQKVPGQKVVPQKVVFSGPRNVTTLVNPYNGVALANTCVVHVGFVQLQPAAPTLQKLISCWTPRRRRNLRKGIRSKRVRSISRSPEPRRGRSESPRKRNPERETIFKRLEKVVFHRLETRRRKGSQKVKIAREDIRSQNQKGKSQVLWKTICPSHGKLDRSKTSRNKASETNKDPSENKTEENRVNAQNRKAVTFNQGTKVKQWERSDKGNKKGEASRKDKLLEILMVQPWQRVAKQRITQNFSSESVISFPPLGEEDGTKGPMIIEAGMGGYFIHRVFVDGGSSSKFLYEHCFNRFRPEVRSQMVPAATPLVRSPFFIQQNHKKARSKEDPGSPIHISLNAKIPSDGWNGHITEQQDCPARVHNGLRTRNIATPIGSTLMEEGRTVLCGLLRRNLDIFVWKPANMIRVPHHIAEHRLNIHKGCLPVRQKKRGQAPERNKAIYKEVEKLVNTVIKSRTEQDVIRYIKETFKTLKEINMKLNPKKCTFEMREGTFLGYKVNADGLKVYPDKVEAVLSLPSPKCLKDVQRLNGKLASLNRFLSKSAEKSLPFLKTLMKCIKKSDFQWTAKAETKFEQMKKLIAELPMLAAPKETEELIIYLAATKEAISAFLMTERDEK
nr:reverse transcriptase domain-containing protein [Tanacetum cinerariifolium]